VFFVRSALALLVRLPTPINKTPYGQPPPAQTGEVSITVNFNNLIVNSTPKILKWDPNNSANRDTTISYSLSSAQEKNCQVVIKVYDMGGNVIYQTALNQHCPGSYSFTWDGTRNQGGMPPGMTAPLGLYTYDITVQGPPPLEEGDRMRSSSLTIGGHDAYMIGENTWRVSYQLQDTKPASQAGVELYDPDLLSMTGITDGTAITPAWNEAGISTNMDVCGTYRFVFWALDNHPEMDKAHRQKPALEVNKAIFTSPAANFAFHTFWGLKGSTRAAAQAAAQEQDKVWGWIWDPQAGQWKKRYGSYKNWKWHDGHIFQKEDKVQVNKTAAQAIKALRRVACSSWAVHSLAGSHGSIVAFGDDTYIAASPSAPGIGKVSGKTVYYISALDSLQTVLCALLLNCSSSDLESAKLMVDTLAYKGAQFVGTVIGGALQEDKAITVSKKFWNYACKGVTENGMWWMCSTAEALYRAVWETFPGKIGTPSWGDIWQGAIWGYYPHYRGNTYLFPPRGGKTDEQLRIMGPNP